MSKWWLSFADANGFLGVCVVEAPDFEAAFKRARAVGCCPGGECRGWALPPEAGREYPLDQLMNREELHHRGDMTISEAEAKGRVLVDQGEFICEKHTGGRD